MDASVKEQTITQKFQFLKISIGQIFMTSYFKNVKELVGLISKFKISFKV